MVSNAMICRRGPQAMNFDRLHKVKQNTCLSCNSCQYSKNSDVEVALHAGLDHQTICPSSNVSVNFWTFLKHGYQ